MKEDPQHELIIAGIVDRTGWTYQEIMNTPLWLLETLALKWAIDKEHQNKNV